ncbi:MAG: hypothetical protein ACXWVS_05855 [Hyphomicrobium sp.]
MSNQPEACSSPEVEDANRLAGPAPALVVFSGDTSVHCLRVLRAGFRHCFVAVCRNDHWIICDPLCHRIDLLVITKSMVADLGQWYRHHGLSVIETSVRAAPLRVAPVRPLTCVEAVKRVLGIHARSVNTPWQLYRYLSRQL